MKDQNKKNFSILPSKDIHNQIDRVYRAPSIAGQFMKDNGFDSIIKGVDNLDNLDHVTSQDSMLGMLRTGGIQLADLRYSAWERGLMDNSHPSSSGKLYFLSMSRNRANEFSDGMLTAVGKQGLVFRICFSGRTLSKYESRIDALGRYLSGDYSDADLDKIRWRFAGWILASQIPINHRSCMIYTHNHLMLGTAIIS